MPDLELYPYGVVQDFSAAQSAEEPDLLLELRRESRLTLIHPRMLSGAFQGRLLAMLSRMIKPQRILEIGTYSGYGSLCLAEGLDDGGELITIERDEELTGIQNRFFQRSAHAHQIKPMIGDALKLLPTLSGTFDLIFLDADKEHYHEYVPLLENLLEPGGFLLIDNMLWDGKSMEEHKDAKSLSIKKTLDYLKESPSWEQVLLPLRDGLMLCQWNS